MIKDLLKRTKLVIDDHLRNLYDADEHVHPETGAVLSDVKALEEISDEIGLELS